MKQHITVEDLQQLKKAQRDKLREWWEPSKGDLYVSLEDNEVYVYTFDYVQYIENSLPLLNIGQMMAFLNDHTPIVVIGKYIEADGICDQAWDMVKYHLSKGAE